MSCNKRSICQGHCDVMIEIFEIVGNLLTTNLQLNFYLQVPASYNFPLKLSIIVFIIVCMHFKWLNFIP